MTTAIYLIISGVLIGAGISIVWRDIQKKRRGAFVSARDARIAADPEIEITIEHGVQPDRAPRALPPPPHEQPVPLRAVDEARTPSLASSVQASRHAESLGYGAALPAARGEGQTLASALAATPLPAEEWTEAAATASQAMVSPPAPATARAAVDPPRQGARLALEQQWAILQPAIAAGVERTNALLAPVRLVIGPVGEPSWSYKNRGYGAYRRVLMGGESVAWLRLELFTDGHLRAAVNAHRDDRATVNATADTAAAGLGSDRATELFSECLQPAATYAARKLRDSDEEASEQAWESVAPLVAAALKATNGALAQAGARLFALGPAAWEIDLRRHRMALSVEVNGDDVARMHIERLPHEMEVAVGVRDPQLATLARRRRIPVDGMTIHALAELIASCAWPAIARFRENRRQA
jgi:hypothetical protein